MTVVEYIESTGCYCVSLTTLRKQFTDPQIEQSILEDGLNRVVFQGTTYIGTEQARLDYYIDKARGENPFYQTS